MAIFGIRKTEDNDGIPSWSNGTDAEIAEALAKHYAGEIDLTQYWSVGDERTIHLSAMPSGWDNGGTGEGHVAQDVTLVIMNVDNGVEDLSNPNYNNKLYKSINGHKYPIFIIGLKNALIEPGFLYYTSSDKIYNWSKTSRMEWCEFIFREAIPLELRNIIKQVYITRSFKSTSTSVQTFGPYYFFFPAANEILIDDTLANNQVAAEYSALSCFEYYKTAANRVKKLGNSGQTYTWWTGSLYKNNESCYIDCELPTKNWGATGVTGSYGLVPHFCI